MIESDVRLIRNLGRQNRKLRAVVRRYIEATKRADKGYLEAGLTQVIPVSASMHRQALAAVESPEPRKSGKRARNERLAG
jgi:hypothetical protein